MKSECTTQLACGNHSVSIRQVFRLRAFMRRYESTFLRPSNQFVDLCANLMQVAFQSLCVFELAVSFGLLDEGL